LLGNHWHIRLRPTAWRTAPVKHRVLASGISLHVAGWSLSRLPGYRGLHTTPASIRRCASDVDTSDDDLRV